MYSMCSMLNSLMLKIQYIKIIVNLLMKIVLLLQYNSHLIKWKFNIINAKYEKNTVLTLLEDNTQ